MKGKSANYACTAPPFEFGMGKVGRQGDYLRGAKLLHQRVSAFPADGTEVP